MVDSGLLATQMYEKSSPTPAAMPPHDDSPSGGAVFSTGSISFAGSLAHNGYDNDICRIATNVVLRFADAAPFDYVTAVSPT